jgi:hypothetical protein
VIEARNWGRKRCPHCREMVTLDAAPRLAHFRECAPRSNRPPEQSTRKLPAEARWIADNGWSGKQ